MEEIFANSGFHHIAEIICKYLEPESYQKLVSSCKTTQNFSALISGRWLKKSQDKGLCLDPTGTSFLRVLEESKHSKYNRIIGIIFHTINHEYCITESYTINRKNARIQSFKAYYKILKLFIDFDKTHLDKLYQLAENSPKIRKILLVCMNRPNQGSSGDTIMHSLALHGYVKENVEVVKFAASLCENPNPQNYFGETPMHIAAEHGHVKFVKALIPYWNNKMAKNHEGKTAIQIAKEKGYQEIMDLMIQNTVE